MDEADPTHVIWVIAGIADVANTKTRRHEGIAHEGTAASQLNHGGTEAQRGTETAHARMAAESATVFDRRHRDGVWPVRTWVFVPATHRPGPLCSVHSGSACATPGTPLVILKGERGRSFQVPVVPVWCAGDPNTRHSERTSPRVSRRTPIGCSGRSSSRRDAGRRSDLRTRGGSFDGAPSEAAPLRMTCCGGAHPWRSSTKAMCDGSGNAMDPCNPIESACIRGQRMRCAMGQNAMSS